MTNPFPAALALLFSRGLTGVGLYVPVVEESAKGLVRRIDFNKTVLNGMLGFLPFAAAPRIDLASRKALFVVLVQGTTVGPLMRRWLRPPTPAGETA